jgi:hypothetical protein
VTEEEVLLHCHRRCAESKNTSLFAPCRCRCKGLYHGTLHMKSVKRTRFLAQKHDLQADLKHAMEIVVKRAKAATELRIKQARERFRAVGLRG